MRRSAGVMLVEVMVALLVVGIALPAMLSQIIAQADATADLRDRSYAQWVAQNQLELLRIAYALDGDLLTGEIHGEVEVGARTWYWTALSEQTEMERMWRQTVDVGSAPDEVLYSAVTFVKERQQNVAAPQGSEQ